MRGRKPGSPRVTDLEAGRRNLHLVDGGGGDPPDGGGPETPRYPPAPEWVTEGRARELWAELLPQLIRRHQWLNLFKVEFGRYCNSFAIYCEAAEKVALYGSVVKTPNGYPTQSPYETIRNRQNEIMLRLAADLGLNPVAQQRLDGVQLDMFDLPAPGADPGGGERFAKYK